MIEIRLASHSDVPFLAAIERAAGEMFRDLDMNVIADDEPIPEPDLLCGVDECRLWVAVSDSQPVAYLLATMLERSLHIDQLTVHPDFSRRRISARLIDTLADDERSQRAGALTLTTFKYVRWNAPYYERLGFRELADIEWPEDIARIVAHERILGLHVWPRVVMIKHLR